MSVPLTDEHEYVPTLAERIAEAIPTELTATPHVGSGAARRAQIAAAVLPVVEAELAEVRSVALGNWDASTYHHGEWVKASTELAEAREQLTAYARTIGSLTSTLAERDAQLRDSQDAAKLYRKNWDAARDGNNRLLEQIGDLEERQRVALNLCAMTPEVELDTLPWAVRNALIGTADATPAAPVPAPADGSWRYANSRPLCAFDHDEHLELDTGLRSCGRCPARWAVGADGERLYVKFVATPAADPAPAGTDRPAGGAL